MRNLAYSVSQNLITCKPRLGRILSANLSNTKCFIFETYQTHARFFDCKIHFSTLFQLNSVIFLFSAPLYIFDVRFYYKIQIVVWHNDADWILCAFIAKYNKDFLLSQWTLKNKSGKRDKKKSCRSIE